jgi:hypothetical protein
MFLAGVPVTESLVRTLADRVDDQPLATKLRTAIERETRVLALELGEREILLRALEDCPEGLGEFRATLLRDLQWRRSERLAQRRVPAGPERLPGR